MTGCIRKLIENTTATLAKKGGKKIDYENFDFHKNIKKTGDTAILDSYVNVQLNVMYLNSINLYSEKSSFSYSPDGNTL